MSKKLQFFIIHCTATPEGRAVTPDEIRQWHLGPFHDPKTGIITYKGKSFRKVADLPDEKIGGIHVSKLRGRGWQQVGYSDMILLDGTIVNLVPYDNDDEVEPWEITNGANGTNAIARHLVYVGGLDKSGKAPKDTRTEDQVRMMTSWVRHIINFNPSIRGAGHNQFANKDCPSFFVPTWLKSIGVGDKNIFLK